MSQTIVANMLQGAAVGALATAPMTLTMLATKPLLTASEQTRLPPEQVTAGVLRQTGLAGYLSHASQERSAMVAHYAFGAAGGALYSLVAPTRPSHQMTGGVLLGLGIWTASYFYTLPAAGVRHSAQRDTAGRHAQLALSHIVWGATTGWLWGVLNRNEKSR